MTATMRDNVYVNVGEAVKWPSFLPQPSDLSVLQHVWVQILETQSDPNRIGIRTNVLIDREIVLAIPGLDAVALTVSAVDGGTLIPLDVQISPTFAVRLVDVPIGLRLKSDLFRPARRVSANPDEAPRFEVDPDKEFLDITLARVTLGADGDGNITFEVDGTIDLPPVMLGDSGVVIEASGIQLYLDANQPPPGKPAGWRGLHIGHAACYLPADLAATVGNLSLTDCYIGNGGFSGTIADDWLPPLTAELFGMEFSLSHVSITFVQNTFTAADIRGSILLPFFDQPIDVEIAPSLNGTFAITLGSANGLITLSKPDLLDLTVESLGFEIAEKLFTVKVSGSIKPLVGGLDWPTFNVRELSIDSEGHVRLEGGWLDLPDQFALTFYGFQIAITKIGFGKLDDGGKWIGFSGALRLVDGLSAGASVDGLRVTWYEDGRPNPIGISLDGVGVEFEVPNVVRFLGEIAYRELKVGNEVVHRFDGHIVLEITSINLRIEATLVIGSATGPAGTYTFFAIYLDVELPAGIPLAQTGLALFGMAGLFALNMEPDKHPDEEWYGIGPTEGWYHRGTVGVTDLRAKWVNRRDSLALGAGVTLGTVADNGFTFNGKVLFVIVFPGPILLIEGKANLLKERATLSDEPIIRALAVLDARTGTFLVGLDLHYQYDSGGELVDIRGGVEAFFSLSDPDAWHIYVGMREPRANRIQADIFQLFQANTYMMLDAHQFAMGAWIGFDKRWNFGPVDIALEAWLEGNALLSFKPPHLHGDLWLHGKVGLKVFGFGLLLSADAKFTAEVFDPFHLIAEFDVQVDLPWPLPDFSASLTLEWGPTPQVPPLPLPLKEVAIEHFKVTESWPLPRSALLLAPNYDADDDGFRQDAIPSVAAQSAAPIPANAPVVPLDARPHLTFGRSVHDEALIGVNALPITPGYERIGDPEKNEGPTQARFSLIEVALDKASGNSWVTVARKGTTANAATITTLFGSWAPMPALPGGGGENIGQTKLWLWSRTPFDYTRHTGAAWDDWFTDRFSGYPCPPPLTDRTICVDFEAMRTSDVASSPWTLPFSEGLELAWRMPVDLQVSALAHPVQGKTKAVCFTPVKGRALRITPPAPASDVRILLAPEPGPAEVQCVDIRDSEPGQGSNPLALANGVRVVALDGNSKQLPFTRRVITRASGVEVTGLDIAAELVIAIPCAASLVRVLVVRFATPPTVTAYTADGVRVDEATLSGPQGEIESVTLRGEGIKRVTVKAPQNEARLIEICYACAAGGSVTTVSAVARTEDGATLGPIAPAGNIITAHSGGPRITVVELRAADRVCVAQICCTIPPDPADVTAREERVQHLRDELARWSQTGAVLEANTAYRLKIVTRIDTTDTPIGDYDHTEFAYFRTQGPPGLTQLSEPIGYSQPGEFRSALDDLTRYVRQTVPATVTGSGEDPVLPRPVYRGYDVGVAFNEDYVDLMYALSTRDLGLYLFDNNSEPLRDVRGQVIAPVNRWGRTDTLTLESSDTRWLTTIDASACVQLGTLSVPHDNTLAIADEGIVLPPDTLHEARLIPLLLHEELRGFSVGDAATGPSGALGRWFVHDEASASAASRWEVRETAAPVSRYLLQTADTGGGSTDARDPVKPGALLLWGDDPLLPGTDASQPGAWTDYRLRLFMRSDDDDAIGMVFRYQSPTDHYRFAMDRARKYRRLMRVMTGTTTVLAEDDVVYQRNRDYPVVIEAIGERIGVYVQGMPGLAVRDATFDHGRIGLYCWANGSARFADIRVDDYRADAPVPYRFSFTTSRFVNVFHHLHDFEDETWRGSAAANGLDAAIAQAVALPTALTEQESRAYEKAAAAILGQEATANAPRVRVTRVAQNGTEAVILVQTSEPLDWQRTSVDLSYAPAQLAPCSGPQAHRCDLWLRRAQ
jgi:hypothetical protein